jgi:hypothetical protein
MYYFIASIDISIDTLVSQTAKALLVSRGGLTAPFFCAKFTVFHAKGQLPRR